MGAGDYKAWVEENPLRKWRTEQGLSMMRTATMLGTGISTVQTWERGSNKPKYENMVKIAKLIGINSVEEAMDRWTEWLKSCPTSLED